MLLTILARHYIEKDKKNLFPTELGKAVNKYLITNFPDIIDYEFTAKIEEEFDKVAERKRKLERTYERVLWPIF